MRAHTGASNPVTYRHRIRWDNLAIVGIAIAVCAVGVPFFLRDSGPATSAAAWELPMSAAQQPLDDASTQMDVADAQRRVALARDAMLAGRFAAAEELLMDIEGEAMDVSGASQLLDEIAQRRDAFVMAVDTARRAFKNGDWRLAAENVKIAAKYAPLPNDLRDVGRQAESRIDEDRSAGTILALIDSGKHEAAVRHARQAYERFHTPRFKRLLTMAQSRLAATNAASTSAASGSGSRGGSTGTNVTSTGGGARGTAPTTTDATGSAGATAGSSASHDHSAHSQQASEGAR